MDYTHIGKNLAFYRRLQQLSQLDLAIRTGGVVSQAYVSRAERGARPLNPTYVAALAAALRIDLETLTRAPRVVNAVKDARVVVLRDRRPGVLRSDQSVLGGPPRGAYLRCR